MGGVSNIASAGINLALAQQANKRANNEVKKDRNSEIQSINEQLSINERDQQAALRKRVASARARAGASGLSTTGGSIDALIRGLEMETNTEISDAQKRANKRIDDIRDSASTKSRNNLLNFASSLTGSSRSSRSLLR